MNTAYGLTRGGASMMLNPNMYLASARAISKGFVQGEATGDTGMLPGTFVVDRQGIIQYAYYSTHAGDHPHIDSVLAEIKHLTKAQK